MAEAAPNGNSGRHRKVGAAGADRPRRLSGGEATGPAGGRRAAGQRGASTMTI